MMRLYDTTAQRLFVEAVAHELNERKCTLRQSAILKNDKAGYLRRSDGPGTTWMYFYRVANRYWRMVSK